ncbi:MAG: GAF domain-containing protein [Ktedonobacteraceae bacterium]
MRKFVGKGSERLAPMVREIGEVVLGLGSIVALSWWIPAAWRSSHLLFCAFFLVVFAAAVRYHKLVAYGTSALAALSYWLLLWFHPEMQVHLHALSLTLEPLLLLLSGICASDILSWQRHRLSVLEQKCADVDETLQKSSARYQVALTINGALERQITELPTSVTTLSDKITHLWKLDGAERYAAIVDLISYAVEAQSCALYMRCDGLWCLSAEQATEDAGHASVLHTDNPLIRRSIKRREVSTIRDSLTEEGSVSREVAVMVGPLLDQAGEMVGMVLIDKMSLLKFTPSSVRLFGSLLQMASLSLQTVSFVTRENHQYVH